MATYKESVGTAVTNFAGDKPGVATGELWYDSSAFAWKYQYPNVTTVGSWSSGNNMNTTRRTLAGVGIQTAALGMGGQSPNTGKTESYDGVSWTEVNDMNTARNANAGAGTYTSALTFGGEPNTAATESWNGTNWTEVNDLGTSRRLMGSAGSDNTSALAFAGYQPAALAVTELWNGTNWT